MSELIQIDLTPPRKDEQFLEYWEVFIEDIRHRENLKPSHLTQLRFLCEICIHYDKVNVILEEHGYTYDVVSERNGAQLKPRPEVTILKGLLTEIRAYSNMLGLQLVKDNESTKKEEKIVDEWE